jgi:Ca2+-binding EF-hand superfamily protein
MNQASLESIMDWEKFCVLRPIRDVIVQDMGREDMALVKPSNLTLSREHWASSQEAGENTRLAVMRVKLHLLLRGETHEHSFNLRERLSGEELERTLADLKMHYEQDHHKTQDHEKGEDPSTSPQSQLQCTPLEPAHAADTEAPGQEGTTLRTGRMSRANNSGNLTVVSEEEMEMDESISIKRRNAKHLGGAFVLDLVERSEDHRKAQRVMQGLAPRGSGNGEPGNGNPLRTTSLLLTLSAGKISFEKLDTDRDGQISFVEYKNGFDILDKDKDGFISRREFGCACGAPFSLLDKDGDGKLSRAEYEAGFNLFDIDGDGYISKEFVAAVAPSFSLLDIDGESLDTDGDGRISQSEYNKGFDLLDLNHDGFVSETEFNCLHGPFQLLDKDGDGMISRKEWENGFTVFDTDGDGFITKNEFQIVLVSAAAETRIKSMGLGGPCLSASVDGRPGTEISSVTSSSFKENPRDKLFPHKVSTFHRYSEEEHKAALTITRCTFICMRIYAEMHINVQIKRGRAQVKQDGAPHPPGEYACPWYACKCTRMCLGICVQILL